MAPPYGGWSWVAGGWLWVRTGAAGGVGEDGAVGAGG